MSEPKNYIEINGRKYDAQTGQVIGVETRPPVITKPQTSDSISMDGVIRRPHGSPAQAPQVTKSSVISHAARSVKPAKTKSTQKSTTLMRPAVKKPDHKALAAKHRPKEEHLPPVIKHAPEERLRRAGEVKKSPHIKRFNAFGHHRAVTKRQEPLQVVHQKPVEAHKENIIEKSIHESVDQFEQVIHEATSHLETYVEENTSRKFRKLAFATASLSVLVLCSFVIYQAVPAVKLKVAGTKAGFSASLPDYSPAGYGLNDDIAANAGEVTLAYSSRTDNKGYQIQQQPSSWNSQSLVTNFLLAENKPYQTFENNGKTIYIYEDTNATWIDGGIWYKIEGDASLTSDQLLRIANGL